MKNRQGIVGSVAQWTISHRRMTVVAWLMLVVLALGASSAVGSHYNNSNSLKGTESQRATDLLRNNFPAQAGDSDQIVLHVSSGAVTDPSVRARVAPMLAQVSRLPHVTGVLSPF